MLQHRVRKLFFLGGFFVPSFVVQAWMTCPSNRDSNVLKPGRGLAITSSMVSMTTNKNNNFEENDSNDSEEKGARQSRLAKAQAEIDRILNNPVDPPFDFEGEMKKVSSISPPLIKEGSAEFQLEEQVSEVEEQLYKAVKAQDYDTAAKKSAEISQVHVDDCGLVLQANSAFYRAFSEKDVGEMERLWLKDRSCICIHPSFKPLSGVRDIMSTWKRMFESSVGSFQRTWIDPCEIQLTVKATTAVITCVEDVYARRFIRGKRRKSELVNKLTATNIFRKVGGRWYMTYHHSSWHADSDAAKRALKSRNKSSKTNSLSSKRMVSSDPFGKNLLNLRSSRKDDDNDEDEEKSDDPTELESILGMEDFGPELGDGPGKKQQGDAGGSRIISSDLDFLKDLGGLDGMLGMGSSNADSMGLPPGSIIRISKMNNNDADEDDDDGDEMDDFDEDEDDFDDDDDDDSSNEGNKSILEMLADKKKRKKNKSRGKPLRPKCIEALRQLSNDGRISPKQKRVLLTDIISCSARGEKSLVEHAYKVLCVDLTDEEAAEEEFVDQCQVFAESFFEMS